MFDWWIRVGELKNNYPAIALPPGATVRGDFRTLVQKIIFTTEMTIAQKLEFSC